MYEPTDDEADAAAIAFFEYAGDIDGPQLTRRELGITRQGWKIALKAAWKERNGEHT